jgi:5-methylcytosine-specific restriction endonuclease McrA
MQRLFVPHGSPPTTRSKLQLLLSCEQIQMSSLFGTVLHPHNSMTNPGEKFPDSWRDTAQNRDRDRWEQMERNTDYLRRQEDEKGSLDCEYCGKENLKMYHWSEDKRYTGDMATVDHVVPRSRGGDDDEDNLAVSCQPCNARKGDTYDEDDGDDGGDGGHSCTKRFV